MNQPAKSNAENTVLSRPKVSTRSTWHRWRLAVQTITLLLFLYILLWTVNGDATILPENIFFRLDPLLGIAAMLASRSWIAPMALGIAILVLSIALARAWCRWICPLGALIDWTLTRRIT